MKRFVRVFAVVLTLSIVVTLFGACEYKSSKADEQIDNQQRPAEKIKLRVCTQFTGADAWTPAWLETYKDFVAKNPNIEIIDESTPTADDALRTKIKTDFASGNEPDVAYFFNGSDTRPLAESGKLFAWDEELARDTEWSSNFDKANLDRVKYDGKIYALPFIGFYEGIFYNKDLFDENGLAIPKTYEDLLKAVDVFKSKDIIPIAASLDESYYLIETFILSQGGVEGHKNPFDPSWLKGLGYIKELYERGAFNKDALTLADNNARELFINKKAAMMINGSWCYGKLKDKDNTVIAPLPLVPGAKADPTDIITGFSTGWYMTSKANETKNGVPMKFVKYMTSPEITAKFISIGGNPAIKTIVPPDATPTLKTGIDMVFNAKHTTMPIDSRISPDSFLAIRKGIAYVVTGKKTPEQLLKEAEKLNIK